MGGASAPFDDIPCLENRVRHLEASDGTEVKRRVELVEKHMQSIDFGKIKMVPPALAEFRQNYEYFEKDLRREVNELKCVVGCVEACIPRETRKAVDLFKRAAGSGEAYPTTPRSFNVESKIITMRDDLDTRLKIAEESVSAQCERVTTAVHSIEKRLDALGAPGSSAPSRARSPLPSNDAVQQGLGAPRGLPAGWNAP